MYYQHRDVKIIDINSKDKMAIACDSCGGIGDKSNDFIYVDPEITGQLTTRVCLMEVLSVGATPKAITTNICNEPYPTGENILNGINKEISSNNLSCEIVISTEKNIPTSMTALGVTVVGTIHENDICLGKVSSGNYIYLLGLPYVGDEVLAHYKNLPTLRHIIDIHSNWKANEILPVGSSGIKGELDRLSQGYSLDYKLLAEQPADIKKSAGPCSAVIIISDDVINEELDIPLNLIGRIL